MGGVVIVSGLPGVGKSTVLSRAIRRLEEEGIKVGLVNYGTVMLNAALDGGMVRHRDEIRKLKVSEQLKLQKLAANKIRELSNSYDLLLVDTHLYIFTPRGRWPGLSVNNLSELDVKQIIVIEARAEEIAKRRLRDRSRIRERIEADAINEDLNYNRFLAAALTIQTSSPVVFVANHDNMVEEAVDRVFNVLRRLSLEL